MFSKEPEEPNYNDGDEEDDDDEEEGELVVVGSEVGALVKQEVWGGDDSIPRQAAHLKPILDGTGSAVPVPTGSRKFYGVPYLLFTIEIFHGKTFSQKRCYGLCQHKF